MYCYTKIYYQGISTISFSTLFQIYGSNMKELQCLVFFILNVQHCNNQLNFVYISLSTRRSRKEEILKMVILLLQQPATSTYILHEFFVRPVAISTFEIILFIFCYQQFHFLILFQALAKVHDFFFFFLLTFFSISHDKFGIFAKNGNFLCCFYFASLNNKRKTNEREREKRT